MESLDWNAPLVEHCALDAYEFGELVSLDEADKKEADDWWLDECTWDN